MSSWTTFCLLLVLFRFAYSESCDPDEWFRCDDGTCITKVWKCDGESDCLDGSDENEYHCKPFNYIGRSVDLTDLGLANSTTEQSKINHCNDTTEFLCAASHLCIPKYWLCDEKPDCTDGSDEDEKMCHQMKLDHKCPDGPDGDLFNCNDPDNTCLPKRWLCDGNSDCPNGFDEIHYTCNDTDRVESCKNGFNCGAESSNLCLDWTKVCDGKNDCDNGEDENGHCHDSCSMLQCSENQYCQHTPNSNGTCLCDDGYQMNDESICIDVNECQSLPPVCSQKCNNNVGSHDCECEDGYRFDQSQGCVADHGYSPATLLFSGAKEIRTMDIPKNDKYSLVIDSPALVHQPIGVSYDIIDDRVYWTDVSRKVIMSSSMAGTMIKTWNSSDIVKPEFLAIDYIGRNIYFSDSKLKSISACKIADEVYCKKIITEGITNPRGIAVYPTKGLLAYSNWDDDEKNHPHIGLAGLDGQDLQILVNTSLRWPNGLAFDMPSNRLFWGEAFYDLLESIRLDGTGRVSMKPSASYISLHPFSVSVFENTIYWSDQGTREIQSCDKFTGKNHQVLVKKAKYQNMGIHIIHGLLEPVKMSPCTQLKCSHLCLLKKGGLEASCHCPSGFEMLSNGHECLNLRPKIMPKGLQYIKEIGDMTVPTTTSTTTQVTTPSTTSTTTNMIVTFNDLADNSSSVIRNEPHIDLIIKEGDEVPVIVGVILAILLFVILGIMLYCCLAKKSKETLPKSNQVCLPLRAGSRVTVGRFPAFDTLLRNQS